MPCNPYLLFNRQEWAVLRHATPLTLNEAKLAVLRGINENMSLSEVEMIYLPLSRLLNLYVQSKQQRTHVLHQFLGDSPRQTPYIIGIAGSVAGGKSTTARVLQALLQGWPEHPHVELITTDGFLYPNAVLQDRQLMKRKGFPESYNIHALLVCLAQLKAGKAVEVPLYSHHSYDIIPNTTQRIESPDIVILEGLNVLQSYDHRVNTQSTYAVPDFLDFSIYVDAPAALLESWYLQRFLTLCHGAFTDPNAYFHAYAQLPESEALAIAQGAWQHINYVNLQEHILPTRERADLILTKGAAHAVSHVRLRQ